ncbi:MAG: CBS domain-containing protein [Flavobacteriales bacterium]|jgi:signal-transduction protein with cAMP-binding, CBS, and nucleotidyltransferase domain
MRAVDLLSEEIPPLLHTDSGSKAMLWMDEFKVSHLPVLKHGNFVGLISESAILDHLNLDESLDSLFQHLPRPYVLDSAHLYDILLKMSHEKLTVLPILREKEEYLGCVSVYSVMSEISNFGSLREPGGILVLEINAIDYSLAQIAQIVESNQCKILSAYITSHENSSITEVTLKINNSNLSSIIRTFERYDYNVKAAYQDKDAEDDLRTRFETLMHFMKF